MNYIEMIDKERVPQHIAIIMDGNGRWAQLRGKERQEGHQAGAVAVRQLVEDALKIGVKYLTLYTFSTENWKRPMAEVAALMVLLFESVEEELFVKHNVGFRVIGDMSYSSKWELTEAVRSIASKVKDGALGLDEITDETIDGALTTSFMPDPDLLIRTGKEQRLSNFLLWQLAYAEFYFTEVLWPDFNKQELCKAIYEFQCRQRRYGLTGEQVTNDETAL